MDRSVYSTINEEGEILIKHTQNGIVKYYKLDNYSVSPVLHRLNGPAFESQDEMRYYFEGKLHRLNGPAVVDKNKKAWYQMDILHRTDGPAVEYTDGGFEYYEHGELHNTKGPARLNAVCAEYFIHGKRHCKFGPAVVYANGIEEWWQKDNRHRKRRPAIITPKNNYEENYWIDGEPYISIDDTTIALDKKAVLFEGGHYWISGFNFKTYQFHQKDERPTIVTDNEMKWMYLGMLHNEKGPAIVSRNKMVWCNKNKFHRDDGGAAVVIFTMTNIIFKFYKNGVLHNLTGPAIINWQEKYLEWWTNGVKIRTTDDCAYYEMFSDEEILELVNDAFQKTFGGESLINKYKNTHKKPTEQKKPINNVSSVSDIADKVENQTNKVENQTNIEALRETENALIDDLDEYEKVLQNSLFN